MNTQNTNFDLEAIKSVFDKHRLGNPKHTKYFPEYLEKVIIDGRKSFTISEVSKASGIAMCTISRWCEDSGQIVKRLKVVTKKRVSKESPKSSYAKIRLGDHVTIEVPTMDLSATLIENLFQAGEL
jgi:hypothetical protein